MSEHTPTPWAYRPARHDDWGWIRGPKDDEKGIAPLVATARSGNWEPEAMLDQHRAAGTDPYGANAAFIVKAVNQYDAHEAVANAALEMVTCDIPPSSATLERLCTALNDLAKAKGIHGAVGGSPKP